MNAEAQVVAVHGDAIQEAGTITFWRMSGDTDGAKLEAAWTAAGLDPDDLPSLPTDTVACRRAVYEQRGPATIVRPLRRRDDPDGWALISETTDKTIHHTPELHVLPNKIGQLKFETPDGDEVIPSPPGVNRGSVHDIAREIADSYDRHLSTLNSNDMSTWLVKAVRDLDALGLKDTGGVYFVARQFVPQWERITKVVREATPHEVLLIPAMRTDEAVETILSSLQAEAEAEAQSMFDEIAEGSLGGRALRNRADKCAALQRKVQQYERLCGRALPGLTDRLTELSGSLAAARMVSTPDDKATGVLAL